MMRRTKIVCTRTKLGKALRALTALFGPITSQGVQWYSYQADGSSWFVFGMTGSTKKCCRRCMAVEEFSQRKKRQKMITSFLPRQVELKREKEREKGE